MNGVCYLVLYIQYNGPHKSGQMVINIYYYWTRTVCLRARARTFSCIPVIMLKFKRVIIYSRYAFRLVISIKSNVKSTFIAPPQDIA